MTPFDRLDEMDVPDELDVPVCSVGIGDASPFRCVQELTRIGSTENVSPVLQISSNDELYNAIVSGYKEDPWCTKALNTKMDGLTENGNLLYLNDRLIIPRTGNIRETLVGLAHNSLGHFGFDKTYGILREAFYWPGMCSFLENSYIPSCIDCQRNKSRTKKPSGPLHPLPVPDSRFKSVAIDFVGPFPEEDGFNTILTMTDRLGADIRLVPCSKSSSARDIANLFFDNWFCENGLPDEIISDRDILFMSRFWKHLHELTGVKLKMSTVFHPETDGSSERTNKTLNQCLRFHVDSKQRGWVKALPRIRFAMMNTVNASTGFSGFQLRLGYAPRLIPPIVKESTDSDETPLQLIERINRDVKAAADNLFESKILQAHQANKHRESDFDIKVGDKVWLSTENRRKEYTRNGDKIVLKLMPKFDGPYTVTAVDAEHSTVTLDIPGPLNKCRVFHTSLIKRFADKEIILDDADFDPVSLYKDKENIEKIIERHKHGKGWRYLVKWKHFPDSYNTWVPGKDLRNCDILLDFLSSIGENV